MADSVKYVTLTDENFESEVLQSDVPVLIDFWAAWCGPCRVIAPTIEKLAADFEGRAKVGKLDVDNNPQTAMRFGIRSIPTLLFFKDGRVVDQTVGIMQERQLADKLDALIGQTA
jgi:thioredoxin 1